MAVCSDRLLLTHPDREILIYAFRYALGRMSVAPSTVQEVIRDNIKYLSNSDLVLYIREINEAEEHHKLGMEEIDKPMWLQLRDDLENELLSLKEGA